MSKPAITRPSLNAALSAWRECLTRANVPSEPLWVFAENLILEPGANPESFRVGFQTKFTPPDDDALDIAYEIFSETDARVVFYRLGTAGKKSVCILLCDPWLDKRDAANGFILRDDWKISFRPGTAGDIEEISDLTPGCAASNADAIFKISTSAWRSRPLTRSSCMAARSCPTNAWPTK